MVRYERGAETKRFDRAVACYEGESCFTERIYQAFFLSNNN
jgi:hypothetical protein